jgi:uncharacterized membrane protein
MAATRPRVVETLTVMVLGHVQLTNKYSDDKHDNKRRNTRSQVQFHFILPVYFFLTLAHSLTLSFDSAHLIFGYGSLFLVHLLLTPAAVSRAGRSPVNHDKHYNYESHRENATRNSR